eukprot:CAMPEP_0202970188 /NCGR_PEP_ID=MMETSP1396-20130829/16176_1 /ASSEMBLY_ACC=CAM_ASM_000872 /TAXON_ID= /ORGANISM="Pseudokeronopsis sp., Strain Brazil" /LENGTH=43 /DNA_ID= /DNA_START= /DNA_END= /DNA_ORIENTATION=
MKKENNTIMLEIFDFVNVSIKIVATDDLEDASDEEITEVKRPG